MSKQRGAGAFVRRLIAPPALDSERRTHEARTLHLVAWVLMSTVTTFLLAASLEQPSTFPRRIVSILVVAASCIGPMILNRRGWTRLASWLMLGGITAIVGLRIWTSGGINAPATSALVIVVIMAGLLLSAVEAVLVCVVCAALGLVMLVMERYGVLAPSRVPFSPVGMWLNSCMWLTLAIAFQRLTGTRLRDALHRTEIELRTRQQAQHRLGLALDAGNIGVWNQDAASRAITGDATLFELYGLPPHPGGAVPYGDWADRIHPDDRGAVESTLHGLLCDAAHRRIDFRIVRPDGAIRYVEACAAVQVDRGGKPLQIVGVHVDVTERKQAEVAHARLLHERGERVKELRLLHAAARLLQPDRPSSHDLFQELVDQMPGAWQFPECCEARIEFRDITVTTAGWRDSPWRQATSFTTTAGGGVLEVAYLEARPPEHEGPFLGEERTLIDSLADMLVSYIELREYGERLERLVETRTQELRVAKDAAERANRAKTTFLTSMSHEIRTPLNAVLGYAQLLRRDGTLGTAQRQQIGAILSSGDHLMTVINDVLEMSKIEAGHASLVNDQVNLGTLLHDLEQMFRGLAAAKGNELRFAADRELPRIVEADGAKIRQVVINLLSNAVKFTDHGQICVRTSHARSDAQDTFTIVVEDSGSGIEIPDQARIFDKFEQSDRGKRTGGTGLGLAISRHFARLMRGDLAVASTPGKGSAFTFTFAADVVDLDPAAGDDPVEDTLPTRIDPRDATRKILIVEDHAPNRHLLGELLVHVGFDVRTAESGEQAIAVHDTWRPDLIFMDLRMPGMGGVEAIRRLRSGGSRAVIWALTSSGLGGDKQSAIEAGAEAVLLKPYLQSDLLRQIGKALGIRYLHAGSAAPPAAPTSMPADATALSLLLKRVPQGLRGQLHDAVIAARLQRIGGIAEEIGAHSAEAATRIRALARDFNYDELRAALRDAAS